MYFKTTIKLVFVFILSKLFVNLTVIIIIAFDKCKNALFVKPHTDSDNDIEVCFKCVKNQSKIFRNKFYI